MDIIGKIYRDYFINNHQLNGNSYNIDEYEFGGICNIFKKKVFLEHFLKTYNVNFQLVINRSLEKQINAIDTIFPISKVFIDDVVPTALIFDNNGKRTSYVIDDKMIKFKPYCAKNKAACIFYADKIFSKTFYKYDQIYLDTAGNSYEDLYALSRSNNFNKNTVISISEEYLTDKLLRSFLKGNKCTILSHNPTISKIYIGETKISIPNKYYLKPNRISPNAKITGLGDIFFVIISVLNYYKKLPLEISVKEAQKMIANEILLD